jgi:hypothetical protein
MAKMFYTLDEAKVALGKNEEEIKQMAREGRLREFRDGPRLMFKADQVEQIKAEQSGSGTVDLGSSDSGLAIGLVDSRPAGSGPAGSGAGLTLSDSSAGHGSASGVNLKEDTALAADLGLSGSVGGIPSPGRTGAGGSALGLTGSQASRAGVDVFQDNEVERVDPMAQTSMASSEPSAGVEAVGSGSGLLDLTRESDDTSLGAELLDEIAPSPRLKSGDSAAGAKTGSTASGQAGIVDTRSVPSGGGAVSQAPVYTIKADPWAPGMAGLALGAFATLLFAAFVLITGILGTGSPIVAEVADKHFMMVSVGALALPVVFFGIGMLLGKIGS